MDGAQLFASVISGGLAGALVSTYANRIFHWRELRTQFHPKLNDIMGKYAIRMDNPECHYLTATVGDLPKSEDNAFVQARTDFFLLLPKYNELREARELLHSMKANLSSSAQQIGPSTRTDLMPEFDAIHKCLLFVQKKLKL